MKKLFILFFMVVVANITVGCSKNEVLSSDENNKQDIVSRENYSKSEEVTKNKTVKIDTLDTHKVSKDNVISVKAEASFKTRCQTFEEIYDNSKYIVRGTVEKVDFTVINGMPYTVLSFRVTDSLKGDMEKNTINTVMMYGGYMTVKQEVDYYNDAERFKEIKKKDWGKTFIEKRLIQKEYPKCGEEYVISLGDSDIVEGAYVPVNEFETVFKKENERYVRTVPSEDYFSSSVNNSEKRLKNDRSFEYSWLKACIRTASRVKRKI
ncbi:hypothetical protein [Eubacterium xylanophilum]|uniref:hypothetical protein n=1 Tax=Eubacterium xylanophilum TaxID=39497 RepID=UPI00047EC9C8|nr:hypothetical protein [Eubacterium xylanophilum]